MAAIFRIGLCIRNCWSCETAQLVTRMQVHLMELLIEIKTHPGNRNLCMFHQSLVVRHSLWRNETRRKSFFFYIYEFTHLKTIWTVEKIKWLTIRVTQTHSCTTQLVCHPMSADHVTFQHHVWDSWEHSLHSCWSNVRKKEMRMRREKWGMRQTDRQTDRQTKERFKTDRWQTGLRDRDETDKHRDGR